MNSRAAANSRYQPTCYEHAANCYTHAVSSSVPASSLLIVPAFVGMALLYRLSDDGWERVTAWVYGTGLCALFLVSTVFHIVTWKKSHMRLNLRELGPLASHMRWFVWLMAAGGTIYVFNYHENDGVIPFAHAIWHVFVAMAAAVHYYAIWKYLYRSPAPDMIRDA
ncbi:hypothetical protein JZ751_013078 [Albula glossodonta]|uniref:Uncharacterized protein n=1 Tax=Albula glossodonta TaxID=121402 RepID=A0A8T2NWN2_9TELE|nr:hypothetical protein JZ751_013078 [Albula glossodonta]